MLEVRDLDTVQQIEKLCFSSPWPHHCFESALFDPEADCLAALIEDRLAGYLVAFYQDRILLIANLAVHPGFRRQGIGTQLLRQAVSKALKMNVRFACLDVRESNDSAIRLYQNLGFKVFGRRRNYYRSPIEDSLSMGTVLPGALFKTEKANEPGLSASGASIGALRE